MKKQTVFINCYDSDTKQYHAEARQGYIINPEQTAESFIAVKTGYSFRISHKSTGCFIGIEKQTLREAVKTLYDQLEDLTAMIGRMSESDSFRNAELLIEGAYNALK